MASWRNSRDPAKLERETRTFALFAENTAKLRAICERRGVRRLELFGSASRGDFDPAMSDFGFLWSSFPMMMAAERLIGGSVARRSR